MRSRLVSTWAKLVKSFSRLSSFIPIPVSRTVMQRFIPYVSFLPDIPMLTHPSFVNLIAFSRILEITLRIFFSSPYRPEGISGSQLTINSSDILDFSELQAGKVELEEEAYNITSMINDLIQMATAKKNDKPLELMTYGSWLLFKNSMF